MSDLCKKMDDSLIEKQRGLLVNLRRKLVGQRHTLPYTIYRDEDIESLLTAQPHTIEDLEKVKGFPKDGLRIKGFGKSILEVFNNTNKVVDIDLKVSDGVPEITVKLKRMQLF